jgi:hypothetical protein
VTALPQLIPQAHDEIERLYRIQHENRAAGAHTTAAPRLGNHRSIEEAKLSRRGVMLAARWGILK